MQGPKFVKEFYSLHLHNNGRVSGGGVTNFDYPDEQNIQEVQNIYIKKPKCVCVCVCFKIFIVGNEIGTAARVIFL